MSKETKLHEVLAVEADLKNKSKSIVEETRVTFTKKEEHFDGMMKSYDKTEEGSEDIPMEKKNVVTTVKEKMDHTIKALIDAIDVTITKEETNSSGVAKANLIIEGNDLGELSATSLLSLENTLIGLRNDLYKNIPTLEPTKEWAKDTESMRGVYKSSPNVKFRTETRQKPLIVVPPTAEHPAQATMEKFTVTVGKYTQVDESGKIRPLDKSMILERLDKAIVAIKQARANANNVAIKNTKIAEKLFKYIHSESL